MPELKQVNIVTKMPKPGSITGSYSANYSMTRAEVRRAGGAARIKNHETSLGILNPGNNLDGSSRSHNVPSNTESNKQRKLGNSQFNGGKSGMSSSERVRKLLAKHASHNYRPSKR